MISSLIGELYSILFVKSTNTGMKNIISRAFFFALFIQAFGQNKYPASAISPDLLKHADAVIRQSEVVFDVKNKGMAYETEHTVITILNERAASLGQPSFYYYEFVEIEDIEASVYDGNGTLVRNLKKKDIKDIKPLQYFVNDFRYKVLDLPSRNYPYTVEYSVRKKMNGLMFYPEFQPQLAPSISVEKASFEIIMPNGLEVRYKEINMPIGSKVGKTKWELKNIPAFKPPPFSTEESLGIPMVIASPTEFSFGGVDGDMKSWESYGAFMYKLIKTQQDLSPELRAKLHTMVSDCPNDMCKIERIYAYLQENTRYFYVGYGIGGWQPALASKVDQYKYGDCKGLSNYTVAMLREVGVPANYVVIKAGEENKDVQFPDFPNPHFNHIIACVPLPRDTIWLECTSQTESCGFLSDFTDNRMALMVTPRGGVLMHTPVYDETKNTIQRSTTIKLEADGSASLVSEDTYSCIAQDLPAALEGLHDEERRKYLYEILDINNFEITALDFVRHKGRFPSVVQHISLNLPKYASVNGKRFFLPLCVMSSKLEVPVSNSEAPNFFRPNSRGLTEADSVVIELPKGLKLEALPQAVALETKFGTYQNTVSETDGKLFIKRKLVLNGVQQPKEAYAEFIGFLKAVNKADKAKIVLVKDSVGP